MKQPRPRSADLGGLLLATAAASTLDDGDSSSYSGTGGGWLGHGQALDSSGGTYFAELLSDMYNETCFAVHEGSGEAGGSGSGSGSTNSEDYGWTPRDMPRETKQKLVDTLDEWGFEPHRLEEEEVLGCTMILFEALFMIEGMRGDVGVSLDEIYPLIDHLRRIYRRETSYHNFEHALDVLQASYIFLREAGMVPSVRILLEEEGSDNMWRRRANATGLVTRLRNTDLLVLYLAAIGHDVAHPGITNAFMINASAPLSQVYDGQSPLENLHCSVLLRVMRHHNLSDLLDSEPPLPPPTPKTPTAPDAEVPIKSRSIRRLLYETVLATDMSVHSKWMATFGGVLSDIEAGQSHTRENKENEDRGDEKDEEVDEEEDWKRRVLMCQAIIKCADISNPSRPFAISRHWSTALMGEWTSQASLERCLGLPCTVQEKDDPETEAKSQIFFATTFARPLWEVLVRGVPELQPFLDQCNSNLATWQAKKAELEALAAAEPSTTITPEEDSSPVDVAAEENENSTSSPSALEILLPPPSSTSTSVSFDEHDSASGSTSSSRTGRRIDDYATAFPLALPKSVCSMSPYGAFCNRHSGYCGSEIEGRSDVGGGESVYSAFSPDEGPAALGMVLGDEDVSDDAQPEQTSPEGEQEVDAEGLYVDTVNVSQSHSRPMSNATSATLFSPGGIRVPVPGCSKVKHHHHRSSRSSVSRRGRERHSRSSSSRSSISISPDMDSESTSGSASLFTLDREDDLGSESGDSEYHSASETGWSRSSSPVRVVDWDGDVQRGHRERTMSEMSAMSAMSDGSVFSAASAFSGVSAVSALSGVTGLSGLNGAALSGGSSKENGVTSGSGGGEGGKLLKKRSFNGVGGIFKFGGKNGNLNASTTNFWSCRSPTSASGKGNQLHPPAHTSYHRSPTCTPSILSSVAGNSIATTTHTHMSTQDAAHAVLRVAAGSAQPGLRKKRSMANRKSWSPSIADSGQAPSINGIGNEGFLAPNSTLSTYSHSSSPSPTPSPSLSSNQSDSLSPSPPPPSSPLLLPLPPITSPASLGSYVTKKEGLDKQSEPEKDITPKKNTKSPIQVVAELQEQERSILTDGHGIGMGMEVVEGTKAEVLSV